MYGDQASVIPLRQGCIGYEFSWPVTRFALHAHSYCQCILQCKNMWSVIPLRLGLLCTQLQLFLHLYFHKFSYVLIYTRSCFIEMQTNVHCSYTIDEQIIYNLHGLSTMVKILTNAYIHYMELFVFWLCLQLVCF